MQLLRRRPGDRARCSHRPRLECLTSEYRPESVESPPWDSGEGGYQATAIDVGELIRVHMEGEPDPELWSDIEGALHDEPWFERNIFALRPHDQLLTSWRRFADLVIRTDTANPRPPSPASDDPDSWVGTESTLDAIGDAIADLPSLIKSLPAGTALWRVRASKDGTGFADALEIAPPEQGSRKGSQRMSADGVNWFYGASTPDLAVAEKYRDDDRRFLCRGRFDTLAPMVVLDLTDDALALPSIYDRARQQGRLAALFLHEFAQEISRPIEKDETHRYRPTQVMTEYIRRDLPGIVGTTIDGIAYPSSRGAGRNLILFHDRSTCVLKGDTLAGGTRLSVDAGSVEVLDHASAASIAADEEDARGAANDSRASAWGTWAFQRWMMGLPPH